MLEMTQNDVEILLQHYGWWGVSEAAEADDGDWLDDEQDKSDKLWNIGHEAYIATDYGYHSRFDRKISI